MVPLHGQAAWLGESVPVYGDAALLRSADRADRVNGRFSLATGLIKPPEGAQSSQAQTGFLFP